MIQNQIDLKLKFYLKIQFNFHKLYIFSIKVVNIIKIFSYLIFIKWAHNL